MTRPLFHRRPRWLTYTAWEYIATGALRRLMRLRKGPVIAALYPVGMLLGQLVLALLLLWAMVSAAGLLRPWLGVLADIGGLVAGAGCGVVKMGSV